MIKKIIALLLSTVFVLGLFSGFVFVTSADPAPGSTSPDEYLKKSYRDVADKAKQMGDPYLSNENYAFYLNEVTGDFMVKNKKTGQFFCSNPWDISKAASSDEVKQELMSQVLIKYLDGEVEKSYNSFKDCVLREQLKVKPLKNGVRVEYTIGNEETRLLLPIWVKKERLEELILPYIKANVSVGDYERAMAFYVLHDLNKASTEKERQEMLKQYPCLEDGPIYVFASDAKDNQKIRWESLIKAYCGDTYSYEQLEEEYAMLGYEAQNKAPAVFKFALEYRLNDTGFEVRLGANGLRFDESNFKLKEMSILPYAGACNSSNDGYLFVPDGSGAIIRYRDFKNGFNITSPLYGNDYAYHTVNGSTEKQRQWTMPVYGAVTSDSKGNSNGYFAIIESGESLVSLKVEGGGTRHPYNTVYTSFNPRPSDTYKIGYTQNQADAPTVTVASERKYASDFKLRFYLLDDQTKIDEEDAENSYDTSYVGMAKAYREYLYDKGVLSPLKEAKENIPFYLESFGTMDTQEKVLSFPVTVETPLTTFEDLKTITGELEENGIDNVNLRLTGFVNGGMYQLPPTKAEFQDEVGGDKGYKTFLDYAKEKGIGVYPDFDFVFLHDTGMFDGFSFDDDAVKTIDGRYTSRQEYSAVFQELTSTGEVVMTTTSLGEFYQEVKEDIEELGANGISAATLGKSLNSDFNEDNQVNREDARYNVCKTLAKMRSDFGSLMVDAGNSYTWQYADHLLNVALDSSQLNTTSQAVPFVGMVLHGSVEFAGSPMNTSGDIKVEVLKAIENGASPYFKLSYRNAEKLKEDATMARYYSVRYDIWKDDVFKYYEILNEALKDVQTDTIVGHEFLEATRVATEEELKEDEEQKQQMIEKEETEARKTAEKENRAKLLEEKLAERKGTKTEDPDQQQGTQNPGAETGTQDTENTETPENPEDSEDPEEPEEKQYVDLTKYNTQLGSVVKVTYSSGKTFILNYNDHDIVFEEKTVPALGFIAVEEEVQK